MDTPSKSQAGLWVRFPALGIDLLLVYVAIRLILAILIELHMYMPFELSFLLAYPLYSFLLTGNRGQTLGKALCGIGVVRTSGDSIGYSRAFAREFLGKILSALPVGLGFFWMLISRRKRAWHDALVDSEVIFTPFPHRARVIISVVSLALWLGIITFKVSPELILYRDADTIESTVRKIPTYKQRPLDELRDIHGLNSSDHREIVEWLTENSMSPDDYAVRVSTQHQLTIFGESHWIYNNLAFLNQIMPRLYNEAGVTCVVMEFLLPRENEKLAQLVTATHFDSLQAVEIARRSDPWKMWGWKGYWDVMKTVWQINRDRPQSQNPLRIVGGGFQFDGPSLALIGLGEFTVDSPWWEKLRAPWPLFRALLFGERVDHIYARSIERDIFKRQERGIWWGGSSHSRIHQEWPQGTNDRVVREHRRMGRLLYDRYGDQIAQIQLHNSPPAESTAIADLLEEALEEANIRQCGFDLARSPLTNLRDATAKHFQLQPGLSLGDVAPRYIFLEPLANQPRCDWISGYITEEMLAEYKPYYEGKIGHPLGNAQEANQAFSVYKGW